MGACDFRRNNARPLLRGLYRLPIYRLSEGCPLCPVVFTSLADVHDLYVMCACVLQRHFNPIHPCKWRKLPCIDAWSLPRELREEMYRAYITRASCGEGDNTPLIERTLALRREQAALLGYANYAELSMASKARAVRWGMHLWKCVLRQLDVLSGQFLKFSAWQHGTHSAAVEKDWAIWASALPSPVSAFAVFQPS